MAKYRKYSDSEKAEALVRLASEFGGNVHKAAREMDIPYSTLWNWQNRDKGSDKVFDLLDMAAQKILESMPDFENSPHAWANALREIIRARQLIAGQATSRVESKNANIEVGPEVAGISQTEYTQALKNAVEEFLPEAKGKLPEDLSQQEYNDLMEKVILEMGEEEREEAPSGDPLEGIAK